MDSVKEWLTLPEVAWVNDPDREAAKVIEELLVKHVFGDSDKPLTPDCKVEEPGVRVLLWRHRKDNEPSHIVPGLRLRERQSKFGSRRPPLKGYSFKDRSFIVKGRYFFIEGFFSVKLFGYMRIYLNAKTRNSGKTLGMIKLNQPAHTPLTDILNRANISRRSSVVRLYHTLPDGSECRVELLGSLEVSEKDLLFHLDNMRRFVKGNQAQEKRLEQLASGTNGPEQVTGLNIISVPVESLSVPIAPPTEEVEQGDVEAVGQKDDGQNKGGRPPGYLREAFEHAYTECLECGATEIIKPDKLEEFVGCVLNQEFVFNFR